MMYGRSLEIERRLEQVLRLVRTGRYSTPKIADKLGVSVPIVSRCIQSLKERGFAIRPIRTRRWRSHRLRIGEPSHDSVQAAAPPVPKAGWS